MEMYTHTVYKHNAQNHFYLQTMSYNLGPAGAALWTEVLLVSGILCIWESRITTVMICHAIFRWKICSKPRKTAMIVPFLQIKLRQHLLLLYWRMRQVRFFPSAHRVVNQEGSALQLRSLKIALQDCLVSRAEGNSKFLCAACPAPHNVLSMPMWRYLSVKPQKPRVV